MAWLNCTACGNNPPRLEDASEATLQESSAAIGENSTNCSTFFFFKNKKKWKILRSHFKSRVLMFVNYVTKTLIVHGGHILSDHELLVCFITHVLNWFISLYITSFWEGIMLAGPQNPQISITVWAYGSNWSSEVEHPVLYRHQQPDVPMKAISGAWWLHITETLTNYSVTFI